MPVCFQSSICPPDSDKTFFDTHLPRSTSPQVLIIAATIGHKVTIIMASVSSLDKDLRNLRLDKYTPRRANETRQWIEDAVGEKLPQGDLLEALKSGKALCK